MEDSNRCEICPGVTEHGDAECRQIKVEGFCDRAPLNNDVQIDPVGIIKPQNAVQGRLRPYVYKRTVNIEIDNKYL